MSADKARFLGPLAIAGWLLVIVGFVYAVRILLHKSWQRRFRSGLNTRLRLLAAGTHHLLQDLYSGGEAVRAQEAPFVRGGTECRVVDDKSRSVRLWSGLIPDRLVHQLLRYERHDWLESRVPRPENLWSFRASRPELHSVHFESLPPSPKGKLRLVVARAIGFEALAVVSSISTGLVLIIWQYAS